MEGSLHTKEPLKELLEGSVVSVLYHSLPPYWIYKNILLICARFDALELGKRQSIIILKID